MKLQGLAIVALVLLLTAMPQVGGWVACASLAVPASAGSGCSSETHVAMSFAVSCLSCGVALLSDQLFLPQEALLDHLNPGGPPTIPNLLFPPWRPPA